MRQIRNKTNKNRRDESQTEKWEKMRADLFKKKENAAKRECFSADIAVEFCWTKVICVREQRIFLGEKRKIGTILKIKIKYTMHEKIFFFIGTYWQNNKKK